MTGKLALGLDLGGTQVRAALVEDGIVVRRTALRTDVAGGPEGVLQQFRDMAAQICTADDRRRLKGIGVCAPGPLDSETGIVIGIPTLPGWEEFALRDRLAQAFELPTIVENDGIAAAYGEWQFGAGRGLQHLVYVTVSTGIGGGVVVDGRLMHGRRGMGAHIGHFSLGETGPVCSCGTIGCFEAFAAGTALGKRAAAAAADGGSGYLATVARSEQITARHVVDGARQGDVPCLALVDDEARLLGRGFTGLIHLFSPDRVVMGGGVSQAFDLFDAGIHAIIRRDAMPPFKHVPVVPAALGDNSGLIGAAALAIAGTN